MKLTEQEAHDAGADFEKAVCKAPGGSVFFLSGGGGTGKTYRLKQVTPNLRNVIICAFTGDAALLAGGRTASSLFGVPTGKRLDPAINTKYKIDKARQSDPSCKSFRGRWCKKTKTFKPSPRQMVIEAASWIVIDEVSMMPSDFVDFIDAVMRDAKKRPDLPFGGCNVILVGDRGQIPPVMPNKDAKQMREFGYIEPFDGLCSKIFEKVGVQKFHLTKIWRQENPIDGNLLNRVRVGRQLPQDIKRLNGNITSEPPSGATVLCCENKDAGRINSEQLKRLPGELLKFETKLTGTLKAQHKAKEAKLRRKIDTSVYLKEGCRVIVASNGFSGPKDEQLYYVNGDQGVFHGIDKRNRLVVYVDRLKDYIYLKQKKLNDIKQEVKQELEVNKEGDLVPVDVLVDKKVGSYQQFPIRLGYAMSGHKSQGKTLQRVHIFLGSSGYRSPVLKTCGYIYVLLSRVTNLDNLSLDRELSNEDIVTSPALILEEKDQQYEMEI